MIEVGLGFSQKQDPFSAGKEAAVSAKIKIEKYPPVAAFVFSSIEFSNVELIKGIKSVIENIKIIGCSASKVSSTLGLNTYGVTILLVASNEISVATSLIDRHDTFDIEKLGQLSALKLLQQIKKTRHLCLYFSDAFIENPYYLIKGFQDKLGRSFPIIGGFASDNLKFTKTYQYNEDGVFSSGVCACLFAGAVNFTTNIKHGWLPLGRPRIVTKAKDNVIYKIEEQDAIKIYEDFFGKSSNDLKIKYFSPLSARYPLGIYIKEENAYILRNVLKAQDNGSLLCQGDVPQNSQIRLMIGSRKACIEATKECLLEIKNYFNDKKIYFCIILESAWRQKLLGLDLEEEFEIIKNILHKVPFVCVSTYGEQAPLKAIEFKGQGFLHSDSVLALAFGE